MPLFVSHNVTHENVVFWPFAVKQNNNHLSGKKLDSLIQSRKEKDRELVTNRPLATINSGKKRKNYKDIILRHQVMKFNHYSMPTVSSQLVARVLINDIMTGLPLKTQNFVLLAMR